MLRFFRRARQRLAGRVEIGRYLFYTLGELLLVVAGILIALSVNNWNGRMKDRKAEVQYLKEIRDDLEKTLVDLDWDLERHTSRLVRADDILQNLINNQGYQDTLFDNLPDIARDFQLYPKTGAFESLKSIGLGLLSNDNLRLKITDLYQLHIERAFSKGLRQTESLSIEKLMAPFLEKHFVLSTEQHPEELPALREELDYLPEISFFESKLISYDTLRNDQGFLRMLQNVLIIRRNKIFDHLLAKREIESTIRAINMELGEVE